MPSIRYTVFTHMLDAQTDTYIISNSPVKHSDDSGTLEIRDGIKYFFYFRWCSNHNLTHDNMSSQPLQCNVNLKSYTTYVSTVPQ